MALAIALLTAADALGASSVAESSLAPLAAVAPATSDPATTPAPSARSTSAPLRFTRVTGDGGVMLNVVEVGEPSRPAIVFVHGIGQSYLAFEEQLRSPLADTHHLIAFDLRGHGNSDKPMDADAYSTPSRWAHDLAAVLAATGAKRPVLLGWSYGTGVVIDYVRTFGTGSLGGIVLVSGHGGLQARKPLPPAIAQMLDELHERQEGPDLAANARAAHELASLLTYRKMPEPWVARAAQIAMRVPAPVWGYLRLRPSGNEDMIARIDVPTLLVVGARDGGITEADAHRLTGRLADGTVAWLDGVGHTPFAEDPGTFNGLLADFVTHVGDTRPPAR